MRTRNKMPWTYRMSKYLHPLFWYGVTQYGLATMQHMMFVNWQAQFDNEERIRANS